MAATTRVRVASQRLAFRLSKSLALDITERTIILTVFGYYAFRLLKHFEILKDPHVILMFGAELIPMIFILARKPSDELSDQPLDWLFGIAGSIAPLMITLPPYHPIAPTEVIFILMLGGLCLQLSAKVFLGLSFGIIAANRGVKMSGPYNVVRHPMYAGYTLTHIGILLAMPSLLNCALYASAFLLQIVRILREERVLMRDPAYRTFAERVKYRLLPGVF